MLRVAFFVTIEFELPFCQVAARHKTAFFSVPAKKNIVRPIRVLMGGNCRRKYNQQFRPSERKLSTHFFFLGNNRREGCFVTRSNLKVTENPI